MRCFSNPDAIHGACEDYRAGASIDLEHDEADFENKVNCPHLAAVERPGFRGPHPGRSRSVAQLFQQRGGTVAAVRTLHRRGTARRRVPPAAPRILHPVGAIMAQDYLDLLAEFVAETRWEDLHPTAIAAARDVVLDTIGAILAGSRLSENANFAGLAATMSGPGKGDRPGSWSSGAAGLGHHGERHRRRVAGDGRGQPPGRRAPVHPRHARRYRSGRRPGKQRPRRAGEHHRGLRGNLPHRHGDHGQGGGALPRHLGGPSVPRRQRRD